ncbi:MAG: TVP38/TMEM64 family protein [Actinomycetota bacterium]|nr:TVP38/TMEM64 family protein [Actinomycetota bacterium]
MRTPASHATRVQLGVIVTFVIVLVVVSLLVDIPSVADLRDDFDDAGLLGCVGFSLLFAALSLLPVPATIFTIAAGAVFGIVRGLPIALFGATLGATIAFFLGRLLGRELVQRLTSARVDSIDELLNRRGFLAVITLRLIPIVPFAPANYLAGATALKPLTYVVATAIGIVPSCTAYVVVGAYGNRPGSTPFLIAIGGVLVLLIGGAVVARRRRHRASAASGQTARRPWAARTE